MIKLRNRCRDNNNNRAVHIKQELHEKLPIVEAHAVVDPRAVVIHIQDASVANAAVVATVRLPNIAHFAVPPSLRLVPHVETPIWWYNTWICHDAIVER